MSDILADIAAYKRLEVAARKSHASQDALESAGRSRPPRDFTGALRAGGGAGGLALIAEIKKASPSKGLIRNDFFPAALARAYADAGASCLSVLTDAPSFQGSEAFLEEARSAVFLPVLRKDFLIDPWQVAESRALGADAILIIMAMVDDALAKDLQGEARRLGMAALFEVHDEQEMVRATRLDASLIGINNRDLRTFVTDIAVTERLAPLAPASALLVTESGIASASDAARLRRAGACAMLVGESLMRQDDVAEATRRLLRP